MLYVLTKLKCLICLVLPAYSSIPTQNSFQIISIIFRAFNIHLHLFRFGLFSSNYNILCKISKLNARQVVCIHHTLYPCVSFPPALRKLGSTCMIITKYVRTAPSTLVLKICVTSSILNLESSTYYTCGNLTVIINGRFIVKYFPPVSTMDWLQINVRLYTC